MSQRPAVPMLLMAVVVGLGALPAAAGDRPFSAVTTAAAEEDDDRVWSVETTFERQGPVRALVWQAEYAFDPTSSVQFGYGLARDRTARLKTQALELEFKHLFNHIARDGWGWGVALAHAFVKAPGAGWRGGEWQLTLPFSLQLGETAALLHASLGWRKARGGAAERQVAIGAEAEPAKRVVLFGELARDGDETLVNLGVRHWIRKERFAIDLSLQRLRGDSTRRSGLLIGLGWYDL